MVKNNIDYFTLRNWFSAKKVIPRLTMNFYCLMEKFIIIKPNPFLIAQRFPLLNVIIKAIEIHNFVQTIVGKILVNKCEKFLLYLLFHAFQITAKIVFGLIIWILFKKSEIIEQFKVQILVALLMDVIYLIQHFIQFVIFLFLF